MLSATLAGMWFTSLSSRRYLPHTDKSPRDSQENEEQPEGSAMEWMKSIDRVGLQELLQMHTSYSMPLYCVHGNTSTLIM